MNSHKFTFSKGVSAAHAEDFVEQLGEAITPSKAVSLTFNDLPYINAGVGWRIGNALRRYAKTNAVSIKVPRFLKERWTLTFTRSGLGDAFAAHASRIEDDEGDITERFKRYYCENASRANPISVFYGNIHEGVSIDVNSEARFRRSLNSSLRELRIPPERFEKESINSLMKLCLEATQNVYDHAEKSPLPKNASIVSYLSLCYYKSIAGHEDGIGMLPNYISDLKESMPNHSGHFLYLSIVDDGVGIASRHSQSEDIYWHEWETERDVVSKAMQSMESIKLKTHDSKVRGTPGEGYLYIINGLRKLKAYALLRTGRIAAFMNGASTIETQFETLPQTLGYLPGTALEIYVPVPLAPDRQIEFNFED